MPETVREIVEPPPHPPATRVPPSPPPGAERAGGRWDESRTTIVATSLWTRFLQSSVLLPALLFAAPAARAHAFLDHASPAVGSTVRQPPAAISLWFTQELEPAFSTISITDQGGQRVDGGDAKVDARDQTLLHASLKPLPPGTYKVTWHVVSVDTHTTEGTFTFRVAE